MLSGGERISKIGLRFDEIIVIIEWRSTPLKIQVAHLNSRNP